MCSSNLLSCQSCTMTDVKSEIQIATENYNRKIRKNEINGYALRYSHHDYRRNRAGLSDCTIVRAGPGSPKNRETCIRADPFLNGLWVWYADGAANRYAQLQVRPLVLRYRPVDLCLFTYTMPGLQYISMTPRFSVICDSSDVVVDTCLGHASLIHRKESARARSVEWAPHHYSRISCSSVMSPRRYRFSNSLKFHKREFNASFPHDTAVKVILPRNIRRHNFFWRLSVEDHFRQYRLAFSVWSDDSKIHHTWKIL